MIQTKKDLKNYIAKDYAMNLGDTNMVSYVFKRLYLTDGMMAFLYLKTLRKYEYAINCTSGLWGWIIKTYRKWKWHRACIKYNISIAPNIIGPGLWIPHVIGGGVIVNCFSMGSNCSINTNVLVGNKDSYDAKPIIGNNVFLSTGSMVIGSIKIGDNVIVAPNAVVNKDVPSNCIVGGVPAKIIKYLDSNEKS